MHRLFSMFPAGLPGIGLLLLRFAVSAVTLVFVFTAYPYSYKWNGMQWTVAVILAASAILLFAGFLTPVSSTLIALCSLGNLRSWLVPSPCGFSHYIIITQIACIAAAIALVGPGAFSLDAYLYGRHEIVLPPPNLSQRR